MLARLNATPHGEQGMPRCRIVVVVAAVLLAMSPAAASAQSDLGPGTQSGKLPRIISQAPLKPLTLKQARRRQAEARRTGRRPRGPLLAHRRGLTRVVPVTSRRRVPSPDAQPAPIVPGRPTGTDGKLFGFQGTYEAKKWGIVNWVNYVYSVMVPQLGGRYVQPSVAEVPSGGTTPAGCGPIVNNAAYCFDLNAIGWSTDFGSFFFDNHGDAGFATYIAHEYGHGAQRWFGFDRGWFRYTLFAEGFADCMAGGWLYWMSARGYTDTVGRGDTTEIITALTAGSDASTTLDGHGDARWRSALAAYGWNYGMQGCRDWGRYVNSR